MTEDGDEDAAARSEMEVPTAVGRRLDGSIRILSGY